MIQLMLKNKHTTVSAIIIALIFILDEILPIWFPGYTVKMEMTAEKLQLLAASYGLIMAGDANPQKPKQDKQSDNKNET